MNNYNPFHNNFDLYVQSFLKKIFFFYSFGHTAQCIVSQFPDTESESVSHSLMSNSLQPHGLQPGLRNSSAKNTGVGSHFLLQGIFPIQGLNLGLLLCRQILYYLSLQGSPPWILHNNKRQPSVDTSTTQKDLKGIMLSEKKSTPKHHMLNDPIDIALLKYQIKLSGWR